MSPHTAATLLRRISYGVMIFSGFWALAPYDPVSAPAHSLIDFLHWPLGDEALPMSQNTVWISSIGAGLLLAVAILFAFAVAPAIERGDRTTAGAARLALVAWFLVDSAGSVASGVISNALFNVLFFVALMVPLMAVRKTQAPEET